MIKTALAARAILGGGLFILSMTPMQASYLLANLNNSTSFNACGSANPIDPSEPCAGAPNVPSVAVNGPVPGAGEAQAATSYGINKVFASSTGGSINSSSEWQVQFTLTGGNPGDTVPLLVIINYDLTLSAAAGSNYASFGMVLNYDTFSPWRINTSTNAFTGDSCFDRPGQTAIGDCAGAHSGSVSRVLNFTINPNNRLNLSVSASVFGTGAVDAYHTVGVEVVVPDGIGWQYDGLTGNPLNFRYAADTGAVPEPATYLVSALGLAGLGILRRVRR